MAELTMPSGAKVLVDDADVELVGTGWRSYWFGLTQYACRWNAEVGKTEYMHRLIFGSLADGQSVDHINGNGLDNRRANLRAATKKQQAGNSRKRRDGRTSRYRGVSWDSDRHRWNAHIGIDGRSVGLGRFDSEVAAAIAYDVAAEDHFGEFARTNLVMF